MRSCFLLCLAGGALADVIIPTPSNNYNNAQQSSYVPCHQQSVDQCASSCNCQRVACCCGPNCDKQGGQISYNRCVDAGSDSSTWNCPSTATCASYGGREMTATPCISGGTSGANGNNGNGPSSSEFAFGTTFPMLGTQAINHAQTWDGTVYQGTTQQFNPGANFNYVDQYSAPVWSNVQYDSSGNQVPTSPGHNNGQPTPAPDYTGVPCSLANQCPTGYYCQVNTGNNVQQRGSCTSNPSNYWTGGAGQYTQSNFYNSLVHPPLLTDPNHNGPPAPAPGYGGGSSSSGSTGYASSEYNSGSGSSSVVYANGGSGSSSTSSSSHGPVSNSCAQPSVCGYKSASGNCWCDGECQSTGDCCSDISQYCSYPGLTPPPPAPPANCLQDNNQCSARGGCGTSNSAPVNIGSQVCYCDVSCHQYNDCCCSAC